MKSKLNLSYLKGMLFLFLTGIFSVCHFNALAYGPGDTLKAMPRMNKTFLVQVHIVVDSTGLPVYTPEQITASFEAVNKLFSPVKARFEVCRFETVPNFNYKSVTNVEKKEQQSTELENLHNLPARINMYFARKLTIDGGSYCGLASLGGIKYETGTSLLIVCNEVSTIAHELGHYFGLEHTFNGNGNELANGSNCQIAGDFVCDTPADPYNSKESVKDYMDSNCKYKSRKKDANGQYYNPDPSNIMSYYGLCETNKFTRGQYERMVKTFLSNPQAW